MDFEWLESCFNDIVKLCVEIVFYNIDEFKLIKDLDIVRHFCLVSNTGTNLILSEKTGIYI